MNTYEEIIAGRVLDVLRTKQYCNVPAKEFLQLWFNHTNRLKETEVTKKFIEFKKANKLDYVIIMSPNGRSYDYVRFWRTKNESKKELLENSNGQNADDREEENDGRDNVESGPDIRERNGTDG